MSPIHNKTNNKKGLSPVHLITDFWILIAPLILSGCMGVYEGGFECPPGKGLGCTSISEVNRLIDQNQIISDQVLEKGDSHRYLNEKIWCSPWFEDTPCRMNRCPACLLQKENQNDSLSI